MDAHEARLADAVVASHAVRAHGSVLAGFLSALVSVCTHTASTVSDVPLMTVMENQLMLPLTDIDGPEDVLQESTQVISAWLRPKTTI